MHSALNSVKLCCSIQILPSGICTSDFCERSSDNAKRSFAFGLMMWPASKWLVTIVLWARNGYWLTNDIKDFAI